MNTPIQNVNEVFEALEAWINQKPRLDARDYGTGQDGLTAYRAELRSIAADKKRALKALDEAKSLPELPYNCATSAVCDAKTRCATCGACARCSQHNAASGGRLIAGHRFITSEKRFDDARRYTIRDAKPDGTINTIGEFQQFRTRDQARANVLKSSEQLAEVTK